MDLNRWIRGIDDAPVTPPARKPLRLELDHEFADDVNQVGEIESTLFNLVERAGMKLRQGGLAAKRAAVKLDYSDGLRVIRQRTDRDGTAIDQNLFALAKAALYLAWRRRVRIRRLGLILDRLVPPPRQLELFAEESACARKADQLQTALDRIRTSFGATAIRTGRSLAA